MTEYKEKKVMKKYVYVDRKDRHTGRVFFYMSYILFISGIFSSSVEFDLKLILSGVMCLVTGIMYWILSSDNIEIDDKVSQKKFILETYYE